jgi:hypothetical protein
MTATEIKFSFIYDINTKDISVTIDGESPSHKALQMFNQFLKGLEDGAAAIWNSLPRLPWKG